MAHLAKILAKVKSSIATLRVHAVQQNDPYSGTDTKEIIIKIIARL